MKRHRIAKYSLFALLVFIFSACGTSPVSSLERQSGKTLRESEKSTTNLSSMSNAADSVANLVGYIYGICIEKKIAENPQLPIGKINSEQFLKGVAMALSADNESESALLGIVAGMEIRKNLNSIEKETKLRCPDKQTLTGFCQGFLKKDSLSEVDAEELLNKILLEHYSE